MKRNLVLLAVMVVAVFFFTSQSWAQAFVCDEDANDYGYCDTLYVEIFDCDHVYYAYPGSYDSVRVAIYISHDSISYYWVQGTPPRWVQDSIRHITVPLKWWPSGCADSIVFPTYDDWNNKDINPYLPWMHRSLFRHIVDTRTGDTTFNRLLEMVENGKVAWNVYTIFHADTVSIEAVPMDPYCQSWWEGYKTLFATLTFLVYMGEDCDTAGICLDSCSFPCRWLSFLRYDAGATARYVPRHLLPVCDTIYRDTRGDANGDGQIGLADAVYLVNYVFVGGPPPDPLEAGDANCSGTVGLADAVYILNWLFIGGPPPGCS